MVRGFVKLASDGNICYASLCDYSICSQMDSKWKCNLFLKCINNEFMFMTNSDTAVFKEAEYKS